MTNILKAIVVFSLLCFLAPSARAEESVFDRVMRTRAINCGYAVWAPYLLKDANTGKMSGINYDIMEAIGKNLGIKVNWNMEVGIGEVGVALDSHKFDVMCLTIWPSPGRYTGMTFTTRPEFYSAVYAVARADDTRFDKDLNAANNKDIKATGIEGDFGMDLAKEKLPDATPAFMPAITSAAELMMQLTTKKADITFADKGGVNDFNKTKPPAQQLRILENLGPARVYGEHLAVKRGEFQLRDVLDVAMLQLVNDGLLESIVQRYAAEYKADIYPSKKDIQK
ncbi:MAG: transporter substrate-binding domain-containing protein [Alphaproteobacteria bacterium]